MKKPSPPGHPLWPPILEEAARLAARGHYRQFRKRSGNAADCGRGAGPLAADCIPYIAHLMGTATILARCGASPEVVAAGMLHDFLEDVPEAGGEVAVLRAAGARVLELVLAVTEDKHHDRPASESWEQRKVSQLIHLETADEDAVLIKAADALHNLLSLIADLEASGDPPAVWARFNAPPEHQLRYFERLSRTVSRRLPNHPLAGELAAAVEALQCLRPRPDGVG